MLACENLRTVATDCKLRTDRLVSDIGNTFGCDLVKRWLTSIYFFFFFNDTATTEIYTLSLHDALPIYFARPAAEHITAAVSYPGELPGGARYGVTQQLGRLTATMARYAADIPLPDEFTPAGRRQLNPRVRAALDARLAFRRAAQALQHIPDLPAYPGPDDGCPVVRHLPAAAAYLAAGRDLLHTHLSPGPSGTGAGRSYC